MLKVENVTKRYGKFVANDSIAFEVPNGSISLLLGPNGAGKSTLIKCITALLRFEGQVTIDGYDNRSIEAKRRLGYIPELPAVYDLLTVEEHLEFIGRAYKLENWKARADALLDQYEMDDKRQKLGKELSKGMQQKLSLCCALLPEPTVVVLDEPMVGLDPHAIKELKSTIADLKARGCSVLISTHMLDSVADNWDAANIMMNGRFVVSRQNDKHATDDKTLEELFFEITEGHPKEEADA